jgi:GNAT superfamily N-acetyltransferase
MEIVTLAQRPDLEDALWSFSEGWPTFMSHDPVSRLMGELPSRFPGLQALLLDDDGAAIAKAHAIPFVWDGTPADLPDRGWDAVLERGCADAAAGRAPTAVSALEISIRPAHRGTGISARMLAWMRAAATASGVADLVAPVRPSRKPDVPTEPMTRYVARRRDDGLPADPWLRVHARAGAELVKVCPTSMTIMGTLAQWRAWTGLPFDRSGAVIVPGALNPVHVDVDQDHAVYVEPNVWMRHRLSS